MENRSEIFRLAQELHRLLGLDPNSIFGDLSHQIEGMILNNVMFQDIKAKPPVIENESKA